MGVSGISMNNTYTNLSTASSSSGSGSESLDFQMAYGMLSVAMGIVNPTAQDINGLDQEMTQDITPS